MRTRLPCLAAGLVSVLAAACASSDFAREADRAYTSGEAQVERLEILDQAGDSGVARVRAFGTVPDACTRIDRVRRRRFGDTVEVSISTRRPAEARCALEATPFERDISISLAGNLPGLYVVTVNGMSVTLYYEPNPFDDPGHRDHSIH